MDFIYLAQNIVADKVYNKMDETQHFSAFHRLN
jgi:hypothetical protein